MPDTITTAVAASVRAELARAGISARQLADALGLNRGWAHRRLAGEVPFTAPELARIALHLSVPIERLYGPPSGEQPSDGRLDRPAS